MNELNSMHPSAQPRRHVRDPYPWRLLLVAAAVDYVGWWPVMRQLMPQGHDPLWLRAATSMLALAGVAFLTFSKAGSRARAAVYGSTQLAGILLYVYLLARNHHDIHYVVQVVLSAAIVASTLPGPRSAGLFSALTVGALVAANWSSPTDDLGMVSIAAASVVLLVAILILEGRERLLREVRKAAHVTQALLECVPDIIYRFGRDGSVLDCQHGKDAVLPLASLEKGKTRIADCVPPDVAETILAQIRVAIESGERVTFRYSLPIGNRFRHREARLSRENKDSVMMVVRDITDQSAIEERLQQAERMASVGTLAAGAAHEINNPLTSVIANLGLIAEQLRVQRGRLPEAAFTEIGDLVKEALQGGERVRRIVSDLKGLAQTSEGRATKIDLEALLHSCANLVATEVRQKAELVRDFSGIPTVRGERTRLGQVFINLLINAAQAIPEGSPARHQVGISYLRRAKDVMVSVRDTGIGIPPENLRRIFDPFFTTKPVGTGTGLGLPVCHGIIASLGGEIRVESDPGRGTTFHVILPLAEAGVMPVRHGSGPAEPAEASTANEHAPGRLLVIDDDPLVLSSLRRVLARKHEVTVAPSGREGMDLLVRKGPFDVIICDVMMPEMSGKDVYEELRARSPGDEDRLVFITGGAFTPATREFLEKVPNPKLEKPFDAETLSVVITKEIDRHRANA